MTNLAKDLDQQPIPALGYRDLAAHQISVGSASARNLTAFNAETRVITVYSTTDLYFRFGGSTVTAAATDHFIPAGFLIDIVIGGNKRDTVRYMAAIRKSTDGTLYISERQ